ncbi:MAG: YggS family pyridoxal phosphate-dependent enzyme [Firmicutes bacterium]|nr:YggS family pyridoxal phosphate-dependent enzyme [Bacillota bacterium]
MSGIDERLHRARARIAAAAARAGRDPAAVTIVGVTKGVDVERIREALAAGLRDLGENRIQEALPKIAALGPGPRWHFVGRLQRNKARWAAGSFAMVHSVDSVPLADALDRAAARAGRRLPVLIEVNVAGEPTKAGVAPDAAAALVAAVRARAHLEPVGLMTVAPVAASPEHVRPIFRTLRELRDRLREGPGGPAFVELSMGMSDDFEVAVEEGATLVRLGRAIFGPRGTRPRERPGVQGEEGAQEV